jgi:hypothetical protein
MADEREPQKQPSSFQRPTTQEDARGARVAKLLAMLDDLQFDELLKKPFAELTNDERLFVSRLHARVTAAEEEWTKAGMVEIGDSKEAPAEPLPIVLNKIDLDDEDDSKEAHRDTPQTQKGVTVHLHGRLLEMVQELARWQHVSLADGLRRAVTTEYFVQEALQRGERILVEKPNRKVYQVNFYNEPVKG